MSSIIKKHTNLNEIPSFEFEGYIWMSDEQNPIVLKNETFDFSSIKENPFIVEGLLFDKETNTSIHIAHDGTYQIVEYNLNELSKKGELINKEYLPHRLSGVEKVSFKQVWMDEKDENCEDFPVLTLKAIVFCGFKK